MHFKNLESLSLPLWKQNQQHESHCIKNIVITQFYFWKKSIFPPKLKKKKRALEKAQSVEFLLCFVNMDMQKWENWLLLTFCSKQ